MKLRINTPIITLTLTNLLAATTSASLLTQGDGSLPSCANSCTVLTNAQSTCGGTSKVTVSTWSCFCQNVWTASGQSPATMCATECSDPTDNTDISTWYTSNCGSDNGASEHSGSSGSGSGSGTGSGGAAGTSSSASSSSSSSSSSSDGGAAPGYQGPTCVGSWWACHWKWIVMVIVIALGLLLIALLGLWWKKRHQRKQDQIREGFNTGITTRGPPIPASNPNDSSIMSGGGPAMAETPGGSGRDSPVRTRDAFMPYGHGYARSESRLASSYGNSNGGRNSPLARGGTPVGELEKANPGGLSDAAAPPSRNKLRRVMVRERSGDGP